MYLAFQVWGFGALAVASFMHFHQVISWTAAACEAFFRIFALVIHGSSSWLGTLGGHDAFAPVFIMLLSVIVGGSIAMRAMALVVFFSNGNGSVQEPVASSLAVCWNDILQVLGLRIVVLGCGGRQARGLSVAWLAQASPRVDVAKVPIRLVKSFESLVDPFAVDVLMSSVFHDKVSQATEELQQQAAAALGITTLSLRRGQNFYLTCDGSALEEHDNLRRVSPHCRVLMHGQLVGGARIIIPGEWSCAVCGAQGCWPTRRSCYKCGSMKTASLVQLGAFINGYKGHFREHYGMGRPSPPLPLLRHLSRWWCHPD